MAAQKKYNIFFLLFDYVEVLDFAGSFDVFSMANIPLNPPCQPPNHDQGHVFKLFTVTEKGGQIKALHGLKIETDYSFETCPNEDIDVLIIPGASPDIIKTFIAENPSVITWLEQRLSHVPVVASVCVGALILATAGGFDGLECTTHNGSLNDLRAILEVRDAQATVFPGARYIDNPCSENPRILSSAGVSAGIDQAFYMLREILGNPTLADSTATIMEYNESQNWMYGPFVRQPVE